MRTARFVLVLLLCLPFAALAQRYWTPVVPNSPVQVQNPKYPLRVQILMAHWHQTRWMISGFGIGNLLGPTETGFSYTYECDPPFMRTRGTETYSARWKKMNEKLEILTGVIGHNAVDKCTLTVQMRSTPYTRNE